MSIVSITEEEPTLAVAKFTAEIAWSEASADIAGPNVSRYVKEAEELLEKGSHGELANLLLLSADIVLTKAEEKEAECVFAVIISQASSCQTLASATELSSKIGSLLAASTSERPALRLKLLFSLYNALPFTEAKLRAYLRAVRYALDAKIADLVLPTFQHLKPTWEHLKDHRELLGELSLLVSRVLEDQQGPSQESLAYLVKFLGQVRGEDEKALQEARQYAVKACQLYLKSPEIFQTARAGEETVYLNELPDLPAVRQLSSSKADAPLLKLVETSLSGQLSSYRQFVESNPDVIQALGADPDALEAKIRLLSLAVLASEAVNGEVRYSRVQEVLQVDADEVELWAVRAISRKLLHGFLDQMREVIIINQAAPQSFGPSHWKQLRGDLALWKDKLGNVSKILHTAKASGTIPQA